MKRTTRSIAALLASLMLLLTLVASLSSCQFLGIGEETESTEGTTAGADSTGDTTQDDTASESETDPITPPDGLVTYTVSVQTIAGRPIEGLTFFIRRAGALVEYGQTDENGIGSVNLTPADDYTVELSASSLEGYNVESAYPFTAYAANIVLTSSVIPNEDNDLTGVQYELGDIIRDFSVMTTTGETFKLSEALKTKKAVLINFWYSTCSPCINEFPYMQSAYEKFKDDIEVIALNNYPGDTDQTVVDFKASMGLTFPVAKDYSRLGSAFNLQGYPTSIIVDRYGTICLIEIGGLTSEKPFTAAFSHFSSDNYEQKLFTSIEELTPTEIPNVEMPSSEEIGAVLNGNSFTAAYAPETDAADAEYSWPFITGNKHGKNCVYPSNSYKDASFATLHATVSMKAGDALAIDWFASSEIGVDMLYILVDGKDIYRLSGVSEDWTTCYPYVALRDGTHKVSFVYLKDDTTDTGEDCVYLSNFRIVPSEAVNVPTYIPRQAATDPNANGLGYNNYVTVVFNEADGYYHVGSANGPILLVNLMDSTQLSEVSLNQRGYDGEFVMEDGTNLYETLVNYCNYAINGTLYGYSPVTLELRTILEAIADKIGYEKGNPDQWLQACSYYDAYGTDEQLEDPVKGVAFFAAFETLESTGEADIFNTVTYDGRVIMPRGLKYRFVPSVSGAYIIRSQSEDEVNGWIFDETQEIIHTAAVVDRPYTGDAVDTTNVSMIVYLEAGKTYYIDIAYYDIYAAGSFTFTVRYLGESYDHFHLASPGYFTYEESTTGQLNETIAGGIDVALGDDGYYHELLADGTLGSIVYADFTYSTGMFSHSILAMIEMGGFNFALSETDQMVLAKLEELGGDADACREYYRNLWGDSYTEWEEIYQLEDVLAGVYHGGGEDMTAKISTYLDLMIESESYPERVGCVAVDAELAEILQALMDKYTFTGVRHSWTKVCYYYKHLGPNA